MHITDILKKCEELGYHVSKSGLYHIGYKRGFIVKDELGVLSFDKEKFLAWVDKRNEKIPKGYKRLSEMTDEVGVSLAQLYLLIKDPDADVRKIGSKDIYYADPKRIKAVIKKRQDSRKEDW